MAQMGGTRSHCFFLGNMLKNTGRQGSTLPGPRKGTKTRGHKFPTHLNHGCPAHLSHKCPIPISHYVLTSHFICDCEILNIDVPAVLVLPHSTHVCAGLVGSGLWDCLLPCADYAVAFKSLIMQTITWPVSYVYTGKHFTYARHRPKVIELIEMVFSTSSSTSDNDNEPLDDSLLEKLCVLLCMPQKAYREAHISTHTKQVKTLDMDLSCLRKHQNAPQTTNIYWWSKLPDPVVWRAGHFTGDVLYFSY